MKNSNTKNLIRSGLFLALAIVFQYLGRSLPQISQLFVGPAVNTVLILTAAICGVWWGVGVGCLTPLLAWLLGQLPGPFGPFIPFIMIGNAIFVVLFHAFKDKAKFGASIGIVTGSVIKFLFLFLSASKLIKLLSLNIPAAIAAKLATAMGVIQLITALIGGFIALAIFKLLKDRKVI